MRLTEPTVAPSTAPVSLRRKAAESWLLLRDALAGRREPADMEPLLADIDEYDRLSRCHGGRPLASAGVLEIGYGARPYRLIAMQSLGVAAIGVDAEAPVLDGGLRDYARVYRTNGLERTVKTLTRRAIGDRRERAALAAALERRQRALRFDRSRMLVADAAALDLPAGSIDLIVSEDVFEHIALGSLAPLVARMRRWLAPDGLALISPNVFTGITGGHMVDWSRRSFAVGTARRRGEAWDHLRARRYPPNTSLNELWRRDYRELFAREFEIVDEIVRLPDLGRELLTPAVAAELADIPDEELFSNQVRFVLRPR